MGHAVIAYRLTDPKSGNKGSWYVANESGDCINIGVTDGDGKYHQYDSYEGYHSHGWAMERGLAVEAIEVIINLPE